jgi:hypothetical protein
MKSEGGDEEEEQEQEEYSDSLCNISGFIATTQILQ